MEKIRYLTELAHADAWINGGKIPIFPAGTYLSNERGGIYTPDENRLLRSNRDISLLPPGFGPLNAGYTFAASNTYNGARLPDIFVSAGFQEALVLCMSNDVDADAAGRMGKAACVRILNVERLKAILDEQAGSVSRMGRCTYTDEQRQIDHFVKSLDDKWQDEFRFAWPGLDKEVWVELPPGVAEPVDLEITPWVTIHGRQWRRHVQDQVFDGERLELDGVLFSRCTFSPSCVLVFAATDQFGIVRCTFNAPRWTYVGAAAHMELQMVAMYLGGTGAIVENWFDAIREAGGRRAVARQQEASAKPQGGESPRR